jgi:hypothetical protein
MSNHKVVGMNGDPCPRCGEPTQIREHTEITAKDLAQQLAAVALLDLETARRHVAAVGIDPVERRPQPYKGPNERRSVMY